MRPRRTGPLLRWTLGNNNEKSKRSSPDTKKPGTPFGPGTFRQFQFPE